MTKSQEHEHHQKKYKHLQRYWVFLKRSNPHHWRRPATNLRTTPEYLQLFNALLQQNPFPSGEEVIVESQRATEGGNLKGRQLFEELEDASEMGLLGKEEICNGCSSVLIQPSGMQSPSCCSYPSDGDHGSRNGSCSGFCVEREVSSVEMGGGGGDDVAVCGDGERWMVRMAWLALVLITFALGIISWSMILDRGDDDAKLVPT